MKLNSKAAISLTVALILGVIVTAILVLIYNRVSGLRCVIDPFNCMKTDLLALAIECSEARCLYGCNDQIIEKIKSDKFKCSDFCDEESKTFQDTEGKICGEKSYAYPVIVELNERDKKNYKSDDFDASCIIKKNRLEFGFLENLWNSLVRDRTNNVKYLVIDEDLLGDFETKTCWVFITPFPDSLSSFKLKDSVKEINIFTIHRSWSFLLKVSSTTNYIWSKYEVDLSCCNDCSCDEKFCELCVLEEINKNCFFWSGANQCYDMSKDNICIDGSQELLNIYAAKYFCNLKNQDPIYAGCHRNKFIYDCGDCNKIKGASDYETFTQCTKSRCYLINPDHPFQPSQVTECCEKINRCEDYSSFFECKQNMCYDKIGECYWYDDINTGQGSCKSRNT